MNLTHDMLHIDQSFKCKCSSSNFNFIISFETEKFMEQAGGLVKLFVPFFIKSALFHKKVPFLANIERCPKFLEHSLADFTTPFEWNSSNVSILFVSMPF